MTMGWAKIKSTVITLAVLESMVRKLRLGDCKAPHALSPNLVSLHGLRRVVFSKFVLVGSSVPCTRCQM